MPLCRTALKGNTKDEEEAAVIFRPRDFHWQIKGVLVPNSLVHAAQAAQIFVMPLSTGAVPELSNRGLGAMLKTCVRLASRSLVTKNPIISDRLASAKYRNTCLMWLSGPSEGLYKVLLVSVCRLVN